MPWKLCEISSVCAGCCPAHACVLSKVCTLGKQQQAQSKELRRLGAGNLVSEPARDGEGVKRRTETGQIAGCAEYVSRQGHRSSRVSVGARCASWTEWHEKKGELGRWSGRSGNGDVTDRLGQNLVKIEIIQEYLR